MSGCTLEALNLHAPMAKGGGICGQVCLEGGGSWGILETPAAQLLYQ